MSRHTYLVAEVALIAVGSCEGCDARVDGDRQRSDGRQHPGAADDRRCLGRGQARTQRKDDCAITINADRQHRERTQEHRHRLVPIQHNTIQFKVKLDSSCDSVDYYAAANA